MPTDTRKKTLATISFSRMTGGNTWVHLVMIFFGIPTFYPFVALLVMSFKDNPQFYHNRWILTFPMHYRNYVRAWEVVSGYILNSVAASGTTVIGVLVLSCLSAYAFARGRFPGHGQLFYLILVLMMIPGVLTLIPSFVLVKQLGLLNTRWALILPWMTSGQVFGIFLLRSFFDSLPEELFEAARLDGASEFQILWKIVLPLSSSVIGVLAILNIQGTWNNLIWPLVTLTDPALFTIPVGLTLFRETYWTNWGPLFAGYVVVSIPLILLFAFASNLFVEGLASGAIKA